MRGSFQRLFSSLQLKRLIFERDKQQHFAVCLALVIVLTTAGLKLSSAMLATMLVGLAKEVWDRVYGSGFCWFDMLANLLGALAGVSIITVVGG